MLGCTAPRKKCPLSKQRGAIFILEGAFFVICVEGGGALFVLFVWGGVWGALFVFCVEGGFLQTSPFIPQHPSVNPGPAPVRSYFELFLGVIPIYICGAYGGLVEIIGKGVEAPLIFLKGRRIVM